MKNIFNSLTGHTIQFDLSWPYMTTTSDTDIWGRKPRQWNQTPSLFVLTTRWSWPQEPMWSLREVSPVRGYLFCSGRRLMLMKMAFVPEYLRIQRSSVSSCVSYWYFATFGFKLEPCWHLGDILFVQWSSNSNSHACRESNIISGSFPFHIWIIYVIYHCTKMAFCICILFFELRINIRQRAT